MNDLLYAYELKAPHHPRPPPRTIKLSHEPWMGVVHFRDYTQQMDRTTVAELEALVKQAALTVLDRRGLGPETLLLETCGSYRRGKELCNDADILVSCTQPEGQKGLREAIKQVLRDELGYDLIVLKEGGAVQVCTYNDVSFRAAQSTDVAHLYPNTTPNQTTPTTQGYGSSSFEHDDVEAHDNMLTLLKHEGRYRRLDVICPPPDQWGACVLGWSGTTQVEKDIRSYATEKKVGTKYAWTNWPSPCLSQPTENHPQLQQGWYYSQQALFDRQDHGKRLQNPASADGIFHREEEVWTFLGLCYLPLRLRWA